MSTVRSASMPQTRRVGSQQHILGGAGCIRYIEYQTE